MTDTSTSPRSFALPPEQVQWFTEARFGIFIHWGVYAVAGRHEWLKTRERLTTEQYQAYLDHFEADRYDPAQWARAARQAGARYMVVTSKHHDGFCLWGSQLTDYTAMQTPAGRDLLRPLLDAFRNEGLRVGLYHSLIDWHHPEFPVDSLHPQRDDEAFRLAEQGRDIRKYAAYLHGQVRELLSEYGKIDILWFDFSYPKWNHGYAWSQGKGREDWQAEALLAAARELQPHILMNNRADLPADFVTPEQQQPMTRLMEGDRPVIWESCVTMGTSGSWTYSPDEQYLSSEDLVKLLIDVVSKGGNLLLNVAPDARGQLPEPVLDRLVGIGRWMDLHGASIYGSGPADLPAATDCRYTSKPGRLYVHILSWPLGFLHLPGLAGKVQFARFLHDHSQVLYQEIDASRTDDPEHVDNVVPSVLPGTLSLKLPRRRPDVLVPVVELFLHD
ncbi:alpha-L-fucosidase (plasmid) [Deinococcus metallilatus]|uniref:alpha-L-fucosidase n=1 Tax=Deinococcus metallilatus TaxID=1211322 RepID=A0AAJ5F619_9DEIO|nr:alpha-L-fucosidase [Deinococcus metallilatus]MBB5293516.1 alpha-L-fucosidase [Deinococcus metallilatus]QBY06593.1 alpha-L-fucosidase [Deinococcus metallilatus]RXJ17936.1 alpha-L-fucosidase [Deinococcus metallilatus]TLK32207.1 alpha-L-fucosidase [Deinococcus metallilatus]GMA15264.1 alpha-L-fucosidase [Deinococcus metallilatus]